MPPLRRCRTAIRRIAADRSTSAGAYGQLGIGAYRHYDSSGRKSRCRPRIRIAARPPPCTARRAGSALAATATVPDRNPCAAANTDRDAATAGCSEQGEGGTYRCWAGRARPVAVGRFAADSLRACMFREVA